MFSPFANSVEGLVMLDNLALRFRGVLLAPAYRLEALTRSISRGDKSRATRHRGRYQQSGERL